MFAPRIKQYRPSVPAFQVQQERVHDGVWGEESMIGSRRMVKTGDLLFFFSYGIFLVFGILSTSFYYVNFMGLPYKLIKYLCIGLLLFRAVAMQKYNGSAVFWGIVFVLLLVVTRTQSSVATVGYILIFLYTARDVPFDQIAKVSLVLSVVTVLFIVVTSQMGLVEDYVMIMATRTRHYVGFRYSLYGPAFLFNITCLALYVTRKSISWILLIVLTLANYWLYLMTASRLSFAMSLVMIVVFAVWKVCPRLFEKLKFLSFLMVLSFLICFALICILTVMYNGDVAWQSRLNTMFESRLSLGHNAIQEYGVSLFGTQVEFVGHGLDAFGEANLVDTYNYVDSFFIQILIRYGIVFTAFWIGAFTYVLYRCYKAGNYALMICLTCIAIRCVLDDLSLNLYYNSFWLVGSILMTGRSVGIAKVKRRKPRTLLSCQPTCYAAGSGTSCCQTGSSERVLS